MASSSALFSANNDFTQLIDRLVRLESGPLQRLEDQKSVQETRKSAVDSVGSKLSTFDSTLTSFLDPTNNQVELFGAESSDTSAFTVTAGSSVSSSGTYGIEVNQVAKSDIKVSTRFNETDQISNIGGNARSFRIRVGGEIIDINNDGVGDANDEIEVTGLTNGDTLDTVLQRVADAINDSAAGDVVSANVLREESGTVRLSVRSLETGQDNLIEFENDVPGDPSRENIAEFIGLTQASGPNRGQDNNTVIASGSTSGGRLFNASELDAQFQIDGLNFTRSSNTVSDAINGLTIELNNTTSGSETITVSSDTESASENIQQFVDDYNAIVKDIRSKSFLNPETGARGPLANDRLFKELTFTLRNTIIDEVSSASNSDINSIFEIGLNVNQDGTLFIEDQNALDEALENNASDVNEIFASSDGIANRLQSVIDTFISGSNSIINTFQNSIDDQIDLLNDRISSQEAFLERRREQLSEQFEQLQQVAIQAQNQRASLSTFGGNLSTQAQLLGVNTSF